MKNFTRLPCSVKHLILLLTLVWHCVFDWMMLMLVTGLLIHCYSKVVSIVSIGDKLRFPVKEILPHTITKPLPCWCCKQRSILRFFSTLDPAMIQLLLAESQLIAEHSVPPHVQVLLHMLVTPAQTGLMEKGSLPVRSSCKH